MEIPAELRSIAAINSKMHENDIDFFHYSQISEGVKSFRLMDQDSLGGLEVREMLEQIRRQGALIKQIDHQDEFYPDYQDILMNNLCFISVDPDEGQAITDVIKVEGIDGRYKLIIRLEEKGQVFIYEIWPHGQKVNDAEDLDKTDKSKLDPKVAV